MYRSAGTKLQPDATEDDGSCETSCEVEAEVTIVASNWGSEMGWYILESGTADYIAGGSAYTNQSTNVDTVCLSSGASYIYTLTDEFGDGWFEGSSFSISTEECGEIVSTTMANGNVLEGSFDLECEQIDLGCEDQYGYHENGSSWSPSPCELYSCYDGNIVTAIIDCPEQMGVECNGEWILEEGECCSVCIEEEPVAPWDVTITGSNHTIVIVGSTDVSETPLEPGDAIGVFYTNENGELVCGGYTIWDGSTTMIAAQGDDNTESSPEIDGFVAGEEFVWMIWDASEEEAFMAIATYANGPDSFLDFAITEVASLTLAPVIVDQTISLPLGWSNFSTYIKGENMNMDHLLSSIVEDIVIVKNGEGMAYLPEYEFNGIGELADGKGYQIKLVAANTIVIEGTYLLPEENPISLDQGWNMIAYLRLEPSDASGILADLDSDGNLIIAKDYTGQAYLPDFNYNGIGNFIRSGLPIEDKRGRCYYLFSK